MEDVLACVDASDAVVGCVGKAEAHRVGTSRLHRAFSLLVFDSTGERLLLQRRAACKPLFPGYWANTCCSHPRHGTAEMEERAHLGVRRAAARRVREELGVDVSEEAMHCALRLHYRARYGPALEEWEMDHVLVARVALTAPLAPNPDEVAETRWVTRAELRAEVADEAAAVAPWFRLMCRHMGDWWPPEGLAPIVRAAPWGDGELEA